MRIQKAVIRSFDSATYRATVQLVESLAAYLEGVPVSRFAAAEVIPGRSCAVLIYDDRSPADAVVIAIYQ